MNMDNFDKNSKGLENPSIGGVSIEGTSNKRHTNVNRNEPFTKMTYVIEMLVDI